MSAMRSTPWHFQFGDPELTDPCDGALDFVAPGDRPLRVTKPSGLLQGGAHQ